MSNYNTTQDQLLDGLMTATETEELYAGTTVRTESGSVWEIKGGRGASTFQVVRRSGAESAVTEDSVIDVDRVCLVTKKDGSMQVYLLEQVVRWPEPVTWSLIACSSRVVAIDVAAVV